MTIKEAKIHFKITQWCNENDINDSAKTELINIFMDMVTDKKRTNSQNRALHLYFTHISNEFNDLGMTFNYTGIKGKTIETIYTSHIIKEFVWRPIQMVLFDIKSTTQINTEQINNIIDILSKHFAEKGIEINFPSIDYFKNKIYN